MGKTSYPKAKGRTEERWVRLPFWLLESAAWRAADTNERALFVAICMRFDGKNNGLISMSVREAAAAINRNKDTACKAFHGLQRKGLLAVEQKATFNTRKNRLATTWRLTHLYVGHPKDRDKEKATAEFTRWKGPEDDLRIGGGRASSQRAVANRKQYDRDGPAGPNQPDPLETEVRFPRTDGPSSADPEPAFAAADGPAGSDTSISTRGARLVPPVGGGGSEEPQGGAR